MAGDIWLTGPGVTEAPDGVTVVPWNAEGTIAHITTAPELASQGRIHYQWHVQPDPEIGGGATCTSQSDTMIYANFIPTAPGVVELWCRIWDTYSATYGESPHKIVRIAPTIVIQSLPNDNKVCFDDQSPGVLTVGPCQAGTGNQALDQLIEWDITAINGSVLTSNPDPPVGPGVTFTFTGLPADNDEVGEKLITAALPDYNSQSEIMALVFFEKTATNHPDGVTPNWFYYWGQTAASVNSPQVFGGDRCFPGTDGYFFDGPPPESLFHVCNPAGFTGRIQCDNWNVRDGIDKFAAVERHENTHLTDWWLFWPNGYNPQDDNDEPAEPWPGDYIPDHLEGTPPFEQFDPHKRDSDNDTYIDFEDRGYDAECSWEWGSADQWDWTRFGHQY